MLYTAKNSQGFQTIYVATEAEQFHEFLHCISLPCHICNLEE